MSEDKFALVTGGGVGIGKASALALARAGWNVAVAGRRLAPLQATVEAIEAAGRRGLALSCDVGDPDSVAAAFARIDGEFGRLDLLFNNAGVSAPGVPMEDLTFAQWKTVVDANLTGAFLCAQGAFWAGIAATLAISLGTAITTGVLAFAAVFAKAFSMRLATGEGARVLVIARGFEFAAALAVLTFGLALFWGAMAGA